MTQPLAESGDDRDDLEVLAEEFVERRRRGESPSIQEYAERHPDLADSIRRLFPTLDLLEGVKSEGHDGGTSAQAPLRELGDYRLLREIGRGGMGIVYEAEQKTLGRRVALKILPGHSRLDSRLLDRFRLEAQAAARLQHPHIVPVIGLGEHDGTHYYTMQYIDGQGLDVVFEEIRRCLSVPYSEDQASSESVASRLLAVDLGDSSTVLPTPTLEQARTEPDRPGRGIRPKSTSRTYYRNIARIGLQAAEALAYAHAHGVLHRDIKPSNLLLDAQGKVWITDFGLCRDESAGSLTQTGDLVGTLRYLAPERFERPADVRGDVYGLGLSLYELVTLTPAFEDTDTAALMRRITQEAPPRPRSVDRGIPPDLETILLAATASDPQRRYPTAEALAADLRAYLERRPVAARSPSFLYLFRVGLHRHRRLAVTVGIAAAVLLASSVFYVLDLREKEGRARLESYTAKIAATEAAIRTFDSLSARRHLEQAPPEYRNWEWYYLENQVDQSLRDFPGPAQPVESIAYSPDGRWLAAGSLEGVWIYDHETTERIRVLDTGGEAIAEWSADGTRLIVGTGGALVAWRWPEAEVLQRVALPDRALDLSIDSRRGRLATGTKNGLILVFSVDTMEEITRIEVGGRIFSVDFHPDVDRLASGGWDGRLTVWDLKERKRIWSKRGYERAIRTVRYWGGRRIVSVGHDRGVKVWDADNGAEIRRIEDENGAEFILNPDRSLLVTPARASLVVWDPRTGQKLYTLHGPGRDLRCLDFHPQGMRIATGSTSGIIKEWDVSSRHDPYVLEGHMDDVFGAAVSPDGRWLVSGGWGGEVRLWDRITGEKVRTWIGHTGEANVAMSPDGTRVASCSPWEVLVWTLAGEIEQRLVGPQRSSLFDIDFTPDGSRIVAGASDGRVLVWSTSDGRRIARLTKHQARVWTVAVSPDGSWIASGDADGVICVWDADSLRLSRVLVGHEGAVNGLAFHPRRERLASVSSDQTLRLWNPRTGQQVAAFHEGNPELSAHTEALASVTFNPDGSRLAAGTRSGTIQLWDTENKDLMSTISAWHAVSDVLFTPDGKQLISCHSDGRIRIWDTEPLRKHALARERAQTLRAEARPIFERLYASTGDIDETIDRLESAALDPAVKESALRLAHARRGTREELGRRLWRHLTPPDGDPLEQRIAWGIARGLWRAAGHRAKQDSEAYTLFGIAEYRREHWTGARHSLERSASMNAASSPRLLVADLAFLSMTYVQLGQLEEARSTFARLEAHLGDNRELLEDSRVRLFLDEARRKVRKSFRPENPSP